LWFIVLPPKYSFVFEDPADAWGLVLYMLAVAVVVAATVVVVPQEISTGKFDI
jgi:hypothetical protein